MLSEGEQDAWQIEEHMGKEEEKKKDWKWVMDNLEWHMLDLPMQLVIQYMLECLGNSRGPDPCQIRSPRLSPQRVE